MTLATGIVPMLICLAVPGRARRGMCQGHLDVMGADHALTGYSAQATAASWNQRTEARHECALETVLMV